ncbi:MAG: hypothetical protein NZX77_22845, partial [Polyangiaceae bacterium]|nr:hypothetical protein [Polyangiaceae bacterium]
MNDSACKQAVACVAAGCSLSLCATLTSGEVSLARAEAIEDCRANKQKCRSACFDGEGGNSGSSAGSGGSGGSFAGEGGEGGASGEGGIGGSPVTKPTCCEVSSAPGCSGKAANSLTPDEKSVQTCVCAEDEHCCTKGWDEVCVWEVAEFGCGPACPAGGAGGSAGAGGAGGIAGTSGAGGNGGGGTGGV